MIAGSIRSATRHAPTSVRRICGNGASVPAGRVTLVGRGGLPAIVDEDGRRDK